MIKNTISVVIIAKDEEKMLPGCLLTLKWADEVIVIDTGSSDKTVKIAKKYKAKVFSFITGKNYSEWREEGLRRVTSSWIFYADADERVTSALAKELRDIATRSDLQTFSFAVPRRNFVLGKELKHGGFFPDYQKRFFRKDNLTGWKGEVHEEPIYKGALGHLDNPLIHQKHETISEMVEKTNNWSEVEAKLMFQANHPKMNIPRFITAVIREFWYRMIVNLAFLDGRVGIIFALYQVFSRFCSYAKLWELQIKNESSNL